MKNKEGAPISSQCCSQTFDADVKDFKSILGELTNDFNNMLVGITGNAQMLRDHDLVKDEGDSLLRQILECSHRASELTLRLRTISEEVFSLDDKSEQNKTDRRRSENLVSVQNQDNSLTKGNDIVLVIDDEETVRAVSNGILERAGFRAITAASGREGVQLFENYRGRFICVILDLSMPYMKGNLVFAQLKAIDPNVQVYVMSGYSDRQIREEFDSVGLAGFIQKPFQPEALVSAVKSAKARFEEKQPAVIAN